MKYFIQICFLLMIVVIGCSGHLVTTNTAKVVDSDVHFYDVQCETEIKLLGFTTPFIEKNLVEPKLKISIDSLLSIIEYPDIARRAGVHGIIKLSIIIDYTGKPVKVKTIRGLGAGIDEAAESVFKSISFEPAYLNGIAVTREAVVILQFKILDKIKYSKRIY